MRVLIIFLIILATLFLAFIFFKIKISFLIEMSDLQVNTAIKIFGKKFSGKFLLKKQTKVKAIKKLKKKKIRLKNTRKSRFNMAMDIVELIDIKQLNINILIGTPFIGLTVFLAQFFNIAIPSLYALPFRKKKRIIF